VGNSRQAPGKNLGNAGGASESGAKQIRQQRGRPEKRDETADWITYVSSKGRFSLRHPKSWAIGPKQPQYCTTTEFSFTAGADADLVEDCGTEYYGQIYLVSEKGNYLNPRKSLRTDSQSYRNITRRKVIVDNIEGTREAGTVVQNNNELDIDHPLPDGTEVVIYEFYAHGRTYIAKCQQRVDDPDILRDFDLMVTKTLKFSGRTLSAKGEVEATGRRTAQNEKPAVIPAQLENEADAPLVITEAAAEIS
jgi:hypothetical protein